MNIELYINKQLCDIESPKELSITLKRQFLNPAELNTKDAQKSYTITLPATAINNCILGFKNTEEVRGKFVTIYDAYLVIGGVKIFDGKFRLSEIGKDYYSGNLGIPVQRSIKDIFGDRNMNESGEWHIYFLKFAESIQIYNDPNYSSSEYGNIAPCIFPYVMYGLLPKRKGKDKDYTAKNVWDDTVVLTIDDFPPSINCLHAIKTIFKNEGLNISGTAFNDERLTKLYMSYANPLAYEMLWNYGTIGRMEINAVYANYKHIDLNKENVEPTMVSNSSPKVSVPNVRSAAVWNTDLLATVNGLVTVLSDESGGVVKSTNEIGQDEYISYKIVIPVSGYYKVKLNAYLSENTTDYQNKRLENKSTGSLVVSPVWWDITNEKPEQPIVRTLKDTRTEIKVIRDFGEGDFNIEQIDIDRAFYQDAIDQTVDFIIDENRNNYPKYYPYAGRMCFIDPKQDKNLVCGLSFGKNGNCKDNEYLVNTTVKDELRYSNTIAIKGGLSYDGEDLDFYLSAAQCDGYIKCDLDINNQIVYTKSDKFKVDLRGTDQQNNVAQTTNDYTQASGQIESVVWFDKGERITIVKTSDQDMNPYTGGRHGEHLQDVTVNLEIQPYKKDKDWFYDILDNEGSSKNDTYINFDDKPEFEVNSIDLIKFLPSDIKIDVWLESFTKAFNLSLAQVETDTFELNIKQSRRTYSKNVIDLDRKANVNRDRRNSSLNLPSVYEIGFTVSEDERGFVESGDNGGGKFFTGNTEGNVLTQTSSFSYNWFKQLYDIDGNEFIKVPIIANNEAFESLDDKRDYAEMMQKDYSNLAQRFWYKADNLLVSGYKDQELEITLVKNDYNNVINLNYHNRPFSILNNFFTIFVNNHASYTVVECYLSTEEYNRLAYSLVQFNNDLYYPAEIDGYDPLNRRKATLKLIRKLL